MRETLQPFAWNTQQPSSIKEFARFIEYVEKAIQMTLTTEIRRVELLYRVYYVTDGVVANIMNLLRAAQLVALTRKSPTIELGDLSQAFQKHLAKHVGITTDPFLVEKSRFNPPSAPPVASPTNTTSTKPRRKKRDEPSVSDTLKAS